LTSPGSTLGTVAYMSPEQARGKDLDHRTDLFSFGVVLYEVATGQLPFRGESSATIFDAILNRVPVAPVRLNPDLPVELERIINKALEKDRRLRYQTASDLQTDLKRLKRDSESGSSVSNESFGQTSRTRRTLWVASALLGASALVAAGYFLMHRFSTGPQLHAIPGWKPRNCKTHGSWKNRCVSNFAGRALHCLCIEGRGSREPVDKANRDGR